MLANVLVPLDGSSLAEAALPTAISLVRRKHGHVELVIVHENVPYEWEGYEDGPWHSMDESTQVRYIHDKAEQLSSARDLTVGHALRRGDVADQICARAAEVGADMIVMGTHGRTGLARMIVGSVETRRSISRPRTLSLIRPSCGRRRSAIFNFAMSLIREIIAARSWFGGGSMLCRTPSTR